MARTLDRLDASLNGPQAVLPSQQGSQPQGEAQTMAQQGQQQTPGQTQAQGQSQQSQSQQSQSQQGQSQQSQSQQGQSQQGQSQQGQSRPGQSQGQQQANAAMAEAQQAMSEAVSRQESAMQSMRAGFSSQQQSPGGASAPGRYVSRAPGNPAPAGNAQNTPAIANGEWGNLPRKLAKDLSEAQRENVQGEYRTRIETYFRVIAEKAKPQP